MNIKNIKYMLRGFLFCGILGTLVASCADNDFDDDGQGTFYTSTKITAAELIDSRLNEFSSFKAILEKANYFTSLQTYGKYTFYLPNNDAINTYLSEHRLTSVDQLSKETCDTLSRSHIIKKGTYFTSDFGDGKLPNMNMDDHFIVLSSEKGADGKVAYFVNQNSQIIEKDDSVTNGVVHVINRTIVSSTDFLPDYIKKDSTIKIFCEALKATGLDKLMTNYMDETYTCGQDSVNGTIPAVKYGGCESPKNPGKSMHRNESLRYPEHRYFKYTLFIEPDEVFIKNNIKNFEDLRQHAKKVYDEVYPEDAGITDFTDRRNSLNRFIAYHMMDRQGAYSDWAPYGDIYSTNWNYDVWDAEDFWETMCPGQLLRFSRLTGGKLYANRAVKGKSGRAGCEGVRVLDDNESRKINSIDRYGAINGGYFYLDGILEFNKTVRDEVLNCRLRIDATTLSPDFMNQDARGHYGEEILCMFKNAYIKNFKISDETILGVHNDDMWWSSYLGNAVCVKGRYDMTFDLPPVPKEGTYEIRLGYVARGNGSTMQVYLDGEPCGIPFNQTIGSWDSRVGFENDKNAGEEGLSEADCLAYNKSIDKTMRNHGYMKAMDSYRKNTDGVSFRIKAPESLRRILISNVKLYPTGPDPEHGRNHHQLRFRKADNSSPDTEFSFDYIEIVPSDIYNNPNGEDQH